MIMLLNKKYPTIKSLEEFYKYIYDGMSRNKGFRNTKSKFSSFHRLHAYQSTSETQLKGLDATADFFILSIKTTMFVFQIIRPRESPSDLGDFINRVTLKKDYSLKDQIN